jgi:hypothetical protein
LRQSSILVLRINAYNLVFKVVAITKTPVLMESVIGHGIKERFQLHGINVVAITATLFPMEPVSDLGV